MLLILVTVAILERFVKNFGRFQVAKTGFIWAMLMKIIPKVNLKYKNACNKWLCCSL